MSNMENAHSEDMQFDDIDLISACLAQQVPPQKPVQTVAEEIMEQQEIWEGKADETVEQSEEDVSILGLEYQPKRLTSLYVYRIFSRLVGNIIRFYFRI